MGVILIIVEIDNLGLYMQKIQKKIVHYFNYFMVLLYHKLFLHKNMQNKQKKKNLACEIVKNLKEYCRIK